MNKQLIIYMLQKILYKHEIIEFKKVLKDMVLFFVSGSGFSVLAPVPVSFISLYPALDSLKMKK